MHCGDQRHLGLCLGYVPALAYGSCRVSDQGTTLRASDLHNARSTILNPFNLHWKQKVVMVATLSHLATPEVVIVANSCAASGDKVGIMATLICFGVYSCKSCIELSKCTLTIIQSILWVKCNIIWGKNKYHWGDWNITSMAYCNCGNHWLRTGVTTVLP